MNKLILVVLLCSLLSFAGESVDKLENQYFNKLEQLKKDYEAKTLKLAESYSKGLQRMLSEETKKGNFDEAMVIKDKIKELQLPKVIKMPIGNWVIRYDNGGRREISISNTEVREKGGTVKPHKFDGKILVIQYSDLKYGKFDHLNFETMSGIHKHSKGNLPFKIIKVSN